MCVCIPLTCMEVSQPKCVHAVLDSITKCRAVLEGGFHFNMMSIELRRDQPGGSPRNANISTSSWAFIQYKCYVLLQG